MCMLTPVGSKCRYAVCLCSQQQDRVDYNLIFLRMTLQNFISLLLKNFLCGISLNRAFRDHNSPFCIRGAVMGFLNPPKLGNSIKWRNTRSHLFSLIANEDKYTGWQMSHTPLYALLKIKNWKMCRMPPPPATKKVSLKMCRKVAANASNMTQEKF